VVIKEAARAVSERDDRLLAEKMEKLQKAQEEEDSDSGSEDETMGDVDASKLGGALTM
jgi:translation initiation factor 2 subunit 1